MTEINNPTEDSVVKEIQSLVTSTKSILSTASLKAKSFAKFPSNKSYGGDEQEDAAVPVWHIIHCLTNLKERFTIRANKRYKCLECKLEDQRMEKTLFCELSYSGKIEQLQNKIDAWCNNASDLSKRCKCKKMINGKEVDNESIPSTRHEVSCQVVNPPPPQILDIRTRHRMSPEVTINVTESITMAGTCYKLKSSMLYIGTGNRGHWQSLVKESQGYVLYDDEKKSSVLDAAQFKRCKRLGTDFIFMAENRADGQLQSLAFPKPSTSGTCSLPTKSKPLVKGQKLPTQAKVAKFFAPPPSSKEPPHEEVQPAQLTPKTEL